jgi:hypothetical protein
MVYHRRAELHYCDEGPLAETSRQTRRRASAYIPIGRPNYTVFIHDLASGRTGQMGGQSHARNRALFVPRGYFSLAGVLYHDGDLSEQRSSYSAGIERNTIPILSV